MSLNTDVRVIAEYISVSGWSPTVCCCQAATSSIDFLMADLNYTAPGGHVIKVTTCTHKNMQESRCYGHICVSASCKEGTGKTTCGDQVTQATPTACRDVTVLSIIAVV